MTSAGAPFWSGPKRPPSPVSFDAADSLHIEFVLAAANLRAFNFGISGTRDLVAIKEALQDVMVPEFTPQKGVKIQVSEQEAQQAGGDVDDAVIDKISSDLPAASSLSANSMTPVEFEKVWPNHNPETDGGDNSCSRA